MLELIDAALRAWEAREQAAYLALASAAREQGALDVAYHATLACCALAGADEHRFNDAADDAVSAARRLAQRAGLQTWQFAKRHCALIHAWQRGGAR